VLIGSLTIIALAIVGCGGSSSNSSSTAAASSSTAARSRVHRAAPSHVYHVKLTGSAERPPGAPSGIGDAVIALHGSRELCWRFAHLRGFTGATQAHIHVGRVGESGNVFVALSTGPRLRHRGCVAVAASAIKAIESNPHGYYVNIQSRRYPAGAVRAQL
jgi:CHRD domain